MLSGHDSRARAGSIFSQSNVRDISKRREKPYKTEQANVVSRRKKLRVHISYTAAPPGYVFLPLGTPELAEMCKEISRLRGIPVNVVNAKPTNKTVMDPGKVSHHIQRIGYHFRNEVVEEACSRLRYHIIEGRFVSEAELQRRQNSSFLARVMSKYGLRSVSETSKETPDQVAGAIKELFPKIPEKDLDEIVNHAWAEGSSRVGTASDLDLPRRVQLAVIARIRHNYTDYDRLLKAFDWTHARKEVEADCLKKLIEWRGEQDEGNEDDGLEEIVRETIVIDDVDDAPRLRQRTLQRELTPGHGSGDMSDSSLEIVHRPAVADDLRAEDPMEQQHKFFQPRGPARRTVAERNDIARAKIDAIRGQMRAQHAPSPAEVVTRVTIDERNGPPKEIIVGGVVMRRASPEMQLPLHHVARARPSLPHTYPQASYPRQDIAIQSIETANTSTLEQPTPIYTSNSMNTRLESSVPRHGEPAQLQYRRLDRAPQHPQPSVAMHISSPQKTSQREWSSHASFPGVHLPLSWPAEAPLPPIPSAQPNMRYYASQPAHNVMLSAPHPTYGAQTQTPFVQRPMHGAPAPIQPASSNATPYPHPQYWYGR